MEDRPWKFDKSKIFGPTEYILPIDIILFIIAIVSTILTVVLLYITCFRHRNRFSIDTILISLIAGFDFVISCSILISQLFKWITNNEHTVDGSSWCHASLVLFFSSTVISLGLVALFSILRYLIIVRGMRIHNFVAMALALLLVIITYLICLLCYSGDLMVNPSGIYCVPPVWGIQFKDRIIGIYVISLFLISLICIPLFNALVASHYSRIVNELESQTKTSGYSKLKGNILKLILVVIAYIVAISPEFISVAIVASSNGAIKRTSLLDGLVITLLFSITIINSLFTLLLHEDTKREFYMLLGIGDTPFDSFKLESTKDVNTMRS